MVIIAKEKEQEVVAAAEAIYQKEQEMADGIRKGSSGLEMLEKLGYEAFEPIPNGKKALDSIEKLKPDLILLDINLKNSDLDGIQVAEQIHQHYKLPFIFLTAFSDKHTLERAKLTEPYGYIIKPFEESDKDLLSVRKIRI